MLAGLLTRVIVLKLCEVVNIAVDNYVQIPRLVMRRNVACSKGL
jgi:hypothetical protein